ncbi:hypothetical protein KIP88_39220 [Bradyrhizobium sp. SRL28]|uniref:hypothetical protein n=1 Tax=Bradyrhizobium sp. SRL28 TaxID=2836178 RepID=UPI001BDECD04|nr:hypothetical protein [Bradyrhizobium sp. SRL28]MBT1516469.1 hypothetical protein [Bradyrhizobium sp. SRL28]
MRAIEAIWQMLYNRFQDRDQKGIIVAALSGVDIALWDIRGKAQGVPVYRLIIGGRKASRRLYHNVPTITHWANLAQIELTVTTNDSPVDRSQLTFDLVAPLRR